MRELQSRFPMGKVVRERYVVEELLGQGGFGAVYRVRDRRVKGNIFALKEVVHPNKHQRECFVFEGDVLKRLDHHALPRVYRAFEDTRHDRLCMLMDYIEGPNLEKLRLQQTGKRFSLSQVLHLLAPIIEAVVYLHTQQPPIIHRDIKPSNIIVPSSGEGSVLVDFGIAKEYDEDSTTTAVRHCSPGYGAPEQYIRDTSTRTDVYGLAATCYTLLTGEVPIDALYRITRLSGGRPDPLRLAHEVEPSLPPALSVILQRALAVNSNDRFSAIDEFWQALLELERPVPALPEIPVKQETDTLINTEFNLALSDLLTTPPAPSVSATGLTPSSSSATGPSIESTKPPSGVLAPMPAPVGASHTAGTPLSTPPPAKVSFTSLSTPPPPVPVSYVPRAPKSPLRFSHYVYGFVALASLALIVGVSFGTTAWSSTFLASTTRQAVTVQPTRNPPTPTMTATVERRSTPKVSQSTPAPAKPTTVPLTLPLLSGSYSGSIYNTPASVNSSIYITRLVQNQSAISGFLSFGPGLIGGGPFTGTVTTDNRIQFLVPSQTYLLPLFFVGQIEADGSINGSYCSYRTNACDYNGGGYGNWNVVPATISQQ